MLSLLGLIMFLRSDNLLYRDRALFSVGVHVTGSEPGCVQTLNTAFVVLC